MPYAGEYFCAQNSLKDGDNIRIQAKFFGLIAAGIGYKEKKFEIADGSTINDFLNAVNLPVKTSWVVVSVNGKIKDKRTVLMDRDELLILPVGGGG